MSAFRHRAVCGLGRCPFSTPACIATKTRMITLSLRRSHQFHSSITHHQQKHTSETLTINDNTYKTDTHTNVPSTLLPNISRKLHLLQDHPISNTRRTIESLFPSSTYSKYNDLSPVVTVAQNFDSLGFPTDHPGRSRTDTYYVNKDIVLRTHTSAHQAETFESCEKDGYLISADVYRRDAIDRSHYPVFHQMEGARLWKRDEANGYNVANAVNEAIKEMEETTDAIVVDEFPPFHESRNPVQLEAGHTEEEAVAVGIHLKRVLERMVSHIFAQAREAALKAGLEVEEKTTVRWVEAYFPFTSPSWELEVWWQGEWLEVLGCGVVKQTLLNNAGQKDKVGWAFGIGLERIAMLLYGIPDIRLFWSQDERFLKQFIEGRISRFEPFSKYPGCYKDVAFWISSGSAPGATGAGGTGISPAGGGGPITSGVDFHENDFMELVRGIGGDLIEDVKLIDEFTHPKSKRKSMCYRINYRSLERTLTNAETDNLHDKVREMMPEKLGVELR